MESQIFLTSRKLGQQFIKFINQAVSPFHVVQWCRKTLIEKGFTELVQTQSWHLEKSKRYFFTRNNSTIVAFDVGKNFNIDKTGFKIIGAHTDSPCLRLAPISKLTSNDFHQTCVSLYGGGLWHTWFDRDLILGGKIVYKDQQTYTTKLWKSSKPLLKVPNLAIHLSSDRQKFEPNKQSHIRPILSSQIYSKLTPTKYQKKETGIYKKHYTGLIELIASQSKINPESILDLDLYFADHQPAQFFGLHGQYISSPRLDNLFSSFHAITAISQHQNEGSFINIVALFDHEQCGSESAQGAGSNIITQSMQRIYKLLSENAKQKDNYEQTIQRSFVISADMAHGLHPNYSEKHQSNHRVEINKGVVIKTNCNQRYATDLISASILRILAEQASVPLQDFIVKNDSPCGTTIGPIIASKTGIKTIDIGSSMLGMHSIRQTCGVLDGYYYQKLFVQFLKNYENINHTLLNE